MQYTFCWWNTGLSPPRGQVNAPAHMDQVAEKLRFMSKRNIDLFCLGEVDAAAIKHFSDEQALLNYKIIDRSQDEAGTKFNMAFAYRADRMELSQFTFLTKRVRMSKKKVAQSFNVTLADETLLRVFVVHWPSRLYSPEDGTLRKSIGTLLRDSIDDLLDAFEHEKIILLGDFNDEPYNEAIALEMSASRDVSMVQRNNRLLYNPFWRRMSPIGSYKQPYEQPTVQGSYYHRSGLVHRWVVFDQVLVSSALVGGSQWHLQEEETRIWQDPDYFDVGPSKSKTIDHLPVLVAIERE